MMRVRRVKTKQIGRPLGTTPHLKRLIEMHANDAKIAGFAELSQWDKWRVRKYRDGKCTRCGEPRECECGHVKSQHVEGGCWRCKKMPEAKIEGVGAVCQKFKSVYKRLCVKCAKKERLRMRLKGEFKIGAKTGRGKKARVQ